MDVTCGTFPSSGAKAPNFEQELTNWKPTGTSGLGLQDLRCRGLGVGV